MKRLKMRCLTVLMSFFILVNSVVVPPMQVQAAEVMTMTVVEALLAMFGLELGLGNQTDFFGNSEFTDFVDAVADGRTVNMPLYGDVNFSDEQSIMSWIMWGYNTHAKLAGNELVDVALGSSIVTLSKALDKTSYSSTGSSATNVMRNKIDILKDYYDTATDFVGEVKDAFSVMNGTSDSKEMTRTRWDIITGMFSTFMYGTADKISGFVDSLISPDDTVYQGFSDAFLDGKGFDGKGNYESFWIPNVYLHTIGYYGNYKVCYWSNDADDGEHPYCVIYTADNYTPYTMYQFQYGSNLVQQDMKLYNINTGKDTYTSALTSGTFVCPVFANTDDAYQYFKYGDMSGILNKIDTLAYPSFKEEIGVNTFDISDVIKQLIDTIPSVDDIAKVIPEALDKTKDVAGTQNAILSITTAIADIAGIIVDNQDANAQGIIGAIKQQTVDLLNGIKDAILSALEAAVVPDLDYWKKELDARTEQVKENASILLLPLTIITIVFAVFDTENIGDFILEIPQLTVKDYVIFEGYSLNVNQFMQQDFLSWFYNIYLLITDVMIIFWIANYAARKFTTIIEGN